MKPFSAIAVIVFAVVGVSHIVRLVTGWEAEIDHRTIPMWISVLGAVFAGLMAVMLWKERK